TERRMSNVPEPAPETDELKEFRKQWQAELQQKRQRQQASSSYAPPAGPSISTPQAPSSITTTDTTEHVSLPTGTIAPSAPIIVNGSLRVQNRALEAYAQAMQCEQASRLDEALRLYRTAFRVDPDVDRVYHRTSVSTAVEGATEALEALKLPSARAYHHAERPLTAALLQLVKTFPEELSFEPEDERVPCCINALPDELLIHILDYLDYCAIERFATVNRKARVVTLDPKAWRTFCTAIYKPPQIPDEETCGQIVEDVYSFDYRRMWIEQPRVRLDGVYIAVCHYIRPGMSENAWVNVNHLITYHRYLRFYSTGQVISLLANEEHEPQHVIPMFKPSLRMKGFLIGNWQLTDTTIHITDLVDPANTAAKYAFQMRLALHARPLGRWNKLDFAGYDSVNVATGEVAPFALKNERPFWFSKVRSYA
ncbi:hypothetical protein EWM64_g5970, partial [Hericium alpestre]